jgi:hypothetical protein
MSKPSLIMVVAPSATGRGLSLRLAAGDPSASPLKRAIERTFAEDDVLFVCRLSDVVIGDVQSSYVVEPVK